MREINPKDTSRAMAFELWANAPMPMVTFFKTVDVTRIVRYARRNKLKFNMLMCHCIGLAASRVAEFRLLPVDGKLMEYGQLAISVIVANEKNDINSCDIPFDEDLQRFNEAYLKLTRHAATTCTNHDATDCMVIGTSALVQYDIDGAVGMYSGIFNNPYIIWSKYKCHWRKKTLCLSFQFHHVQMDGAHASRFLNELQTAINQLGS